MARGRGKKQEEKKGPRRLTEFFPALPDNTDSAENMALDEPGGGATSPCGSSSGSGSDNTCGSERSPSSLEDKDTEGGSETATLLCIEAGSGQEMNSAGSLKRRAGNKEGQVMAAQSPGSCVTPGPSPNHSPEKQKSRFDLEDPLLTLQTTGQTTTDTLMKQMMMALRDSLQTDMHHTIKQVIQPLQGTVQELGGRTSHVENKLGELVKSHNRLLDDHRALQEETEKIKKKMADAEDRNRRNNLKVRGIPESIQQSDLAKYMRDLILHFLPECDKQHLILDRTHRLPKPKGIPEHLPRDVITRVHFFHIKEDFLKAIRMQQPLPNPYSKIQVFPDLSQATLQWRKQLLHVTLALRQQSIQYRWGFPQKLLVHRDGQLFVLHSVKEGEELLSEWQIDLPKQLTIDKNDNLRPISSEWELVQQRKNSKPKDVRQQNKNPQ